MRFASLVLLGVSGLLSVTALAGDQREAERMVEREARRVVREGTCCAGHGGEGLVDLPRTFGARPAARETTLVDDRSIVTYDFRSAAGPSMRWVLYLTRDGDRWCVEAADRSELHGLLYVWGAVPAAVSRESMPATDALWRLGEEIPRALAASDVPLPPRLGGGAAAVRALWAFRQLQDAVLADAFYDGEHRRGALVYRTEETVFTFYVHSSGSGWLIIGHSFGPPSVSEMLQGLERRAFLRQP